MLKKLSKRNALLISQGAKHLGSFLEGYYYIEEQLYVDEATSVYLFCEWLENNQHRASEEMPFVESNLPNLYKNHFLKERKPKGWNDGVEVV